MTCFVMQQAEQQVAKVVLITAVAVGCLLWLRDFRSACKSHTLPAHSATDHAYW